MAEVSTPNPAAHYPEGRRPNTIISLTPVTSVMVRYVDPEGKEQMVFCYVFGEAEYSGLKDPQNPKKPRRMPGVWIAANTAQLGAQLRLAHGPQALQIIDMMEDKGLIREGRVLGGSAPVAAVLPDFSDVFATNPAAPAPESDEKSDEG